MMKKILTVVLLSFPLFVSAHVNHIDPDEKCFSKVKEMMTYFYNLDVNSAKSQKISNKMNEIDSLMDEKKYCDARELLERAFRE